MDLKIKKAIGARIRKYRESIDLNREQFAEKAEISPQFLAEIENAKKGMSVDTMYKICAAFNLSSDYLVLGRLPDHKYNSNINNILKNLSEPYSTHVEDILIAIDKIIDKKEN